MRAYRESRDPRSEKNGFVESLPLENRIELRVDLRRHCDELFFLKSFDGGVAHAWILVVEIVDKVVELVCAMFQPITSGADGQRFETKSKIGVWTLD